MITTNRTFLTGKKSHVYSNVKHIPLQITVRISAKICVKMPCRQIIYYINSGGKTICVCFVYFRKAFDTVIHPGIRLKLLRNNINGYFY
jgi:hypothetical protein